MRLWAVLTAILACLVVSPAAGAASPYGTFPSCVNPLDAYETQATDNNAAPGGEHIHTGVCLPIFAPLTARTDVDVRTLFHNNDGAGTFVRWSWGSDVIQSLKMNWKPGPVHEAERVDTFTLDPAREAPGFQELRFTSNAVDPALGRWYTTTRWPLANQGSTAKGYSGGPTVAGRCGGAGWYGQYLNVYIDCRDLARIRSGPLSGVQTFRVKLEHEHSIVHVDPKLHDGIPGLYLFEGPGQNKWRTVTLDTRVLANGYHKMRLFTEHTRTSKPVGTFGGAFVIPFHVAN